jgi:hypothetical protein
MNHTVPFEEKSNGQHEDRRGGLAVEDEDEGVDAMVEGRLGDDEHARVDELCDEGDQVRLLCLHKCNCMKPDDLLYLC